MRMTRTLVMTRSLMDKTAMLGIACVTVDAVTSFDSVSVSFLVNYPQSM